jgi:hypothetical protein
LCILEGGASISKVGEPKCFTLGRMNLEGRRGLRVFYREMKELEEEYHQRLHIKVGDLSSIISFVLETLSQHQNMIDQLKDEVYASRS